MNNTAWAPPRLQVSCAHWEFSSSQRWCLGMTPSLLCMAFRDLAYLPRRAWSRLAVGSPTWLGAHPRSCKTSLPFFPVILKIRFGICLIARSLAHGGVAKRQSFVLSSSLALMPSCSHDAMFCCSPARSLTRLIACSIDQSPAHSLTQSLNRLVAKSLGRPLPRSLTCSIA